MSTKTLKVKMAYADASTRIYNINVDHVASTSADMNAFVTNAATRARAMTDAAADTTSSVANTFVSKEGAKFTGIAELSVVISDEVVVYNGA